MSNLKATFFFTEDDQLDSGMFPGAMSLWSRDRSFCLLNKQARRLFKYCGADFVRSPSLWLERIHPNDRSTFCRSVQALDEGKPTMQCDYRFFPPGEREPIWIRELAQLAQNHKDNDRGIISAYTEISDLKSAHGVEKKRTDTDEKAKVLMHDVQNVIHKFSMEIELVLIDLKRKLDCHDVLRTIDSIADLLQRLRLEITGISERPTVQDPATIVDGIVRKMRRELNRQNVNLRLVRREPLPMVSGDKEQLRSALASVFEFCGSMLKNGGNLDVEARRKEIHGEMFAELKVTSSSAAYSEAGEKLEVPSAGHRIDVGLELAREILARYRGRVIFQEESKNRGQVTVLIAASPQ
jgi:PAS fold